MTALSVTPEGAEGTVYGAKVNELQKDIRIEGTKISGTLLEKKNYTGFSSKDNNGYFLALNIGYPEDAEVKVTVEGGSTKDKKLPKGDHLLVSKITTPASQKIKLDITKGGKTGTITYDLTGLTLQQASEAA